VIPDLALALFVFAGLFSPGPNVILITTSGAHFGFRRTLPHIAGIVVGVGIISALTGLGVGALIVAQPALTLVLKIGAAGWILWMAWRLASSARRPRAAGGHRPFTFVQAVLFQWINPKVWAVALAAASGYAAGLSPLQEAGRLAIAFSGINLFVCLFWTWAGTLLSYLLTTPRAWAIFTSFMAVLLALAAAMVFL
jgi:threonine/homoserine/homoserine lactone efflux protein